MGGAIENFFKARLAGWRELILPGILIIGLVCLLRLSGLLQTQEWMALDSFARHCPVQQQQEIAIVGIDEADYQSTGGFPISDRVLAQALEALQKYQPHTIGLDIFRDLPVGEGRSALTKALQSMPNVVAVEVALNADAQLNVPPPPGLPADRVGFADAIVDSDGKLRRSILAARDWDGTLKYSLAVQLARKYLQDKNAPFRHGDRSSDPIQFGEITLPQFYPNSGGYIRADANGNQALINFCLLQQPYDVIALRDLLAGNVDPEQLRDRIVIIGTIAASVKDSFITAAARETLHAQRVVGSALPTQLIYGVEVHAHTTRQIIDSVLYRPCFLLTWPEISEYLWIATWGLLGMAIGVTLQSPWKSVVALIVMTLVLFGLGYGLLAINWWVPVVPAAFALCGAGLITAFFDRDMRFELAQRQIAVDRTYNAVHNGPLQHLAAILRSLDDSSENSPEDNLKNSPENSLEDNLKNSPKNNLKSNFDLPSQSPAAVPLPHRSPSIAHLKQQLQALNTELRGIFEHMRQETTARSHSLYLADRTVLDLQASLSDLLYQVYEQALNQALPGFASVQNYVPPDFECLREARFKPGQKRELCLFLQEALLNIGKHASGATRIDVVCTAANSYRLQIIDNGTGFPLTPSSLGEGTRQAVALAKRLKGEFRRFPNRPQGTVCELSWPRPKKFKRH